MCVYDQRSGSDGSKFHDWISEMAGVKILYGGSETIVEGKKKVILQANRVRVRVRATKWFFLLLNPRNMQTNKEIIIIILSYFP